MRKWLALKGPGAIAVGIMLGIGLFVMSQSARAQDAFAKYCAVPRPNVTLLMIDLTEKYDTIDQRRLATGMNGFYQALRPGWRVDILPINNRPGEITPLFRSCVPGCPEELGEADTNWSMRCDRIGIERDKQHFQARFVEVLRFILTAGASADGTQIVRSLEQVGYQYPTSQIRDVTIFSDMLEFSDLNRKINFFEGKHVDPFVRRANKILEPIDSFNGARVTAFGFGKRLGQQQLVDEKGEHAALLKPENAAHFRTAWSRVFAEGLGVGSFELRFNY